MEAKKTDNGMLSVMVTAPTPDPVEKIYDYDSLVQAKAKIIADANRYLAVKQKELDDVNALLSECDRLEIKPLEMPQPLGG